MAAEPDFRRLFEAAPGLYLVLDRNFLIRAVSDAYLAGTMTRRQDLVGRDVFEVFPDNPNDVPLERNLRSSLERVLEQRVPDTMAVQKYDIPRPAEAGGGLEVRYWSVVNSPVPDDDGSVAYIINRVEDVTEFVRLRELGTEQDAVTSKLRDRTAKMEAEIVERSIELQQANEALRRQAAINTAVLDATLDGITLVDANGEVLLVNSAQDRLLKDLFDLPSASSVDDHLNPLDEHVSDPDRFLSFAQKYTTDPNFEGTDEVDLLSGRSYVLYTAPVRSGTDFLGRVFVMRETTAEREAERLKSELVATVSHELRTPLASILGFAELLSERDYDAGTQTRFLRTIRSEAGRLTELVNEFLDLQRIESGSFRLALEPLALEDLVREQAEVFAGQSELHTIELDLPSETIRAVGERARLARVLANLLSNAIKYSPAGGAVTAKLEEMDGVARVSVADSGIGIPATEQQKIFSKFFRVDSTDTREIGGTGLGLALAREIVEAHGGQIGFESVEGAGATFWFELPVAVRSRAGAVKVLVVEDDLNAAQVLCGYLEAGEFAIEHVPSGEAALAAIEREPPGVICLDMGLGSELDGWDVLTKLKADPATEAIPVVICSAGNGRPEAAALGVSDFLSKPFDQQTLVRAVERALPDHRGSVLVVDDDPAIRSLVAESISGNGIALREAADGDEALQEIARRRPDVIVLDLIMPGIDGFQVLERLQVDASTRFLPVIVLTGRQLAASERELLNRRAVSLLEKNAYSREELCALVGRALG